MLIGSVISRHWLCGELTFLLTKLVYLLVAHAVCYSSLSHAITTVDIHCFI